MSRSEGKVAKPLWQGSAIFLPAPAILWMESFEHEDTDLMMPTYTFSGGTFEGLWDFFSHLRDVTAPSSRQTTKCGKRNLHTDWLEPSIDALTGVSCRKESIQCHSSKSTSLCYSEGCFLTCIFGKCVISTVERVLCSLWNDGFTHKDTYLWTMNPKDLAFKTIH